MPKKTLASLTAQVTDLEKQLADERSATRQARAELAEERKQNERLVTDVRYAEAERSRLQGYIDRVREEQGFKVGEIDTRPMCRTPDHTNQGNYGGYRG